MALSQGSEGRGGTALARRWLLVSGAWGAVALFSVAQVYVARWALGQPPPLGPLLVLEVPIWTFWALLTVPIVLLARRFPLDRSRALGRIVLHGFTAVGIAVVAVGFHTLWYQAFNPYPLGGTSIATWFWQYFRQHFIVGFMIYWAVIGVYHAFTNYSLLRVRELEAAQARAHLSEARLEALRLQIQPHFLFNTLNSISALLKEQPVEARRVIAQLADLLRATLRTDARELVRLDQEVALVRRYLDIEKIRFGDQLDVRLEIAPEARGAAVPSFVLQPLVENAIRHGIGRKEGGGRLRLSAERLDGRLVMRVEDDGGGLAAPPAGGGIGLANTRSRLRELYGTEQALLLRERRKGGVEVTVEIPFRSLDEGS